MTRIIINDNLPTDMPQLGFAISYVHQFRGRPAPFRHYFLNGVCVWATVNKGSTAYNVYYNRFSDESLSSGSGKDE